MVRIHRSLRSRLFHPVHRSCPVQVQDLERRRISVIWYSGTGSTGGWQKVVQEDVWQNGQVPPAPPVTGTWRGWTFFRLAESSQCGQNSSGVPRIHPDSLVWTPPENPTPMPKQLGVSSGAQKRGQRSATERGAVAMASMPAHGLGRAGACPHGLPAGGARVDATGTATSSSFTHGSWSVSGTGDGRDWRRLASVGPAGSLGPPSSTASPVGSYAPPGSTTSSSFPTNPGGPSSSSRPTIKGRGKGLHEYATVVMAPHRPANRLNDGPTMSIREGESEREALLRILQAPLPPNLHPDRPAETPSQRRSRYLQDARSTVVGLLARCDS